MDIEWNDIKGILAGAAPLVGGLLGGPAGAGVGALVAKALGTNEDPKSIYDALQADPQAIVKIKQLELEHERELKALVIQAQGQLIAEETKRISEVNQTFRAEVKSEDAYVRRWRPTLGYTVAAAFGFIMFMLGLSFYTQPEKMAQVATLVTAMMPIWVLALGILGVSVSARSKDKQTAAGVDTSGGGILGVVKALKGS